MKIITRDEKNNILRCFVQVRDVSYMASRFQSSYFNNLLLKIDNKKLKAEDFIEISNVAAAKLIDEIMYIIDFSQYVKYDSLTLSRLNVLNSSYSNSVLEDQNHLHQDFVDLMSFKNGGLGYSIPVLFDGRVRLEDNGVVFGSTSFPGYYMLSTKNRSIDLSEYLANNSESLFKQVSDRELESYDTINVGSELLVRFREKRKENIFDKIKKTIG